MLCRLCVEESTICINLYDEDCLPNEIYKVCCLYFGEELEKLDTSLTNSYKIVCQTCWKIIKDYDNLRKKISAAQLRLTDVENLEVTIKLEEVENEPIAVINDLICDNPPLDEQPEDILATNALSDFPSLKLELKPNTFQNDGEAISENPSETNLENVDLFREDEQFVKETTDQEKADDDDDDENDCKPLSELFKEKKKAKQSTTKGEKRINRKQKSCDLSKQAKKTEKPQRKNKTQAHDKFISDWKEVLPCELCEYTAKNFTELRKHFKAEHPGEKMFVKCCGKKYAERFHLVEHIKIHLDPETFKCSVCGKCSANRRSLVTHMKLIHGPIDEKKPFKCEVCAKTFSGKSILQKHMEIHVTGTKEYICPQCGKGFVVENRLKTHIKNIHSATCVCDQCGKSFRNSYVLKVHHQLDHQGIEKPKWSCDECASKFSSKYSFYRHKRMAHHDGSTLYECSECGMVKLNRAALLRHKRHVHEAIRKFKCTICDKAFKVRKVLREHMTIHTGEELYTCPHCPKTFRVSANMHHHRKKAHPKEWAEKRSERTCFPNNDISQATQKVVI